MAKILIAILSITSFLLDSADGIFKIRINPYLIKGEDPMPKFWKSTGFSPPYFDPVATRRFLMSKDVELNLALISSLPQHGIEYVRIHWLLNLLQFDEDYSITWDLLDTVLDRIVSFGLKPIFELMIMPENPKLRDHIRNGGRSFWKGLTSAIARRYSDRYGMFKVSRWRFETWNEPDLKMYNTLNFGLTEYIEYVIGSIAGIKSVLPDAEFGGPAGLFKDPSRHRLCWGFLYYCNLTLETCEIDYLSHHKKGNGSSNEIVKGTTALRADLKKRFPNLSFLPLVNDEADMLSGWWRDEPWRGDVRYAAAVARTVALYRNSFRSLNLKSISIDNGFLNTPPQFFNQRTLLTRFIDEYGNSRFVQKPIYAAMGLLAFLGEEEVIVDHSLDERFLIIATRTNHKFKGLLMELNVLIVYSADNMAINKTETEVQITTFLSDRKNASYALFQLENTLRNPKEIWKNFGCPSNPSPDQLSAMRLFQEPQKIASGFIKKTQFKIRFNVTQPNISFLRICFLGVGRPGKLRKLRAFNVSTGEILLTWRESRKHLSCIKTYVVEHCTNLMVKDCFRQINKELLIYNSYFVQYSSEIKGAGFYRVAAIDFWNRKGQYSEILHVII